MSHWCICNEEDIDHPADCFEPDCDIVQHWPPLCCRECPCHSYQEAHPLLRVLQAAEDEQVSFTWHGSQLRMQWWLNNDDHRRLNQGRTCDRARRAA